ncbi:MAG TPA: MFS transporter [Steroidobacter sp.]|nr:MFS transporter [Steroidobacter sp.]
MAQTANEAQPVSALSPLRIPIFRAVWSANMVSNFGWNIQSVGAAWLMTSISQSADMVALVQASITLPLTLLSLVAGALADILDRRKIILGAQMFMLTASAALAVFAWSGLVTPWLLLAFTFLLGCGAAFNQPAWQASIAEMTPRTELPGAIALNSMGFNIARSLGPAVGGAIVAAAGAAAAFAVNAISYIPLLGVLGRWRPPQEPQPLPRESLGMAIGSGIRYASMSTPIRTVLVRSAVFGFGATGLMALMPLIAKVLVAGGPLTYGALLGAFGAGAVGGALASTRLRLALSTEVIVRWSSGGLALAAALAAISTQLAVTILALLLAGAAWLLALSTFNAAVQLSVPRWVVARALSLYQTGVFGGMAAGAWLWGVFAERNGVTAALLGAAGVTVLSAALGRWLPLAQTESLNLDPLRSWKEPAVAVPVEPRTGPVVVSIEYVIYEEDLLEFLAAMAERRRIRIRDGARQWTLLRDLANPQLWIERYSTPTWLDYIRHNSRLTQDDASVPERLRALHRGSGAPIVRRMIERQAGSMRQATTLEADDLTERLTDATRIS